MSIYPSETPRTKHATRISFLLCFSIHVFSPLIITNQSTSFYFSFVGARWWSLYGINQVLRGRKEASCVSRSSIVQPPSFSPLFHIYPIINFFLYFPFEGRTWLACLFNLPGAPGTTQGTVSIFFCFFVCLFHLFLCGLAFVHSYLLSKCCCLASVLSFWV